MTQPAPTLASLRRSGLALLPAVLLGLPLLGGCLSATAGGRADRAWRAGDLAAAARAYEAVLAEPAGGRREARALYRLALAHSLSESPVHDLDRAGELLERLLARHPDSAFVPQAAAVLDLQRQVVALRSTRAELAARLDELQGETHRAVTDLRQEVSVAQGEAEAKQARIAQLQRQLGTLHGQIETFNTQIARLQEELRRLKEIDLAEPPR